MNFNHLLSAPGGLSEYPRNGDFLRLGQKRGNEHLVDNISASEVITRRRLEADPLFSTKSLQHLANRSPRFTQLGLGLDSGATNEIPMLNHSAGILPLPKYSRFAEIYAKASRNISETKRFVDSLNSKAMYPSSYGAYTITSEFDDRQQMLSVYATSAESMRRALGKDINKTYEDTMRQTAVNKFTLNGEQIEKTTEAVSSECLNEMLIPASCPRGLYSSNCYSYNIGSDSALSRGFCGSNNSSILLGTNFHAGLKVGRYTSGLSPLLSFETSIQEAMHNTGKCLAEPETTKSVALRKKDKDGSNTFPANVKGLLSTGIFDGVSVKYVSWDRTKNVRGTIQGTGYLCWCKDCKKNKMVNAYQLEQHAGSKSKHPNDHIYFSNGKSIYRVVQELKTTPSDKLLEVIPTVTGSGINNENFAKWKESFQAAGRELQRIFGSDPELGESSSSKNAE